MKKLYLVADIVLSVTRFKHRQKNPKSLPSDSLSTTLHAEQLMAKDTLSVPLPAPVPQHYLYSPFDMYGITPFNYGYATWSYIKDSMLPSA